MIKRLEPVQYEKVPGISFPEATKTVQAPLEDCNINKIIAKAKKKGILPVKVGQGMYGDFTTSGDYHAALLKLQKAEKDFMALPASTRQKFDNDAGKLIDWVQDPKNLEEAVKLGLLPQSALPQAAPRDESKSESKSEQKKADQ